MKKYNKKNIVVKAAAVFVALLFVSLTGCIENIGAEGWTGDWLPKGETNQGITGEWSIEPYIVFSDGSHASLKKDPEALYMKHGTKQVETIVYVLKAQATRDDSVGAFTGVEMDFSDLVMNVRFDPSYTSTIYMDVWNYPDDPDVLPFPSGSLSTEVIEVARFTLPTDIDGSSDRYGSSLSTLPCNTMNQMTEGWQEGQWQVTFSFQGTINFRGVNSEYGNGDWKSAQLPGSSVSFIDIIDYEVNMDWDSESYFVTPSGEKIYV